MVVAVGLVVVVVAAAVVVAVAEAKAAAVVVVAAAAAAAGAGAGAVVVTGGGGGTWWSWYVHESVRRVHSSHRGVELATRLELGRPGDAELAIFSSTPTERLVRLAARNQQSTKSQTNQQHRCVWNSHRPYQLQPPDATRGQCHRCLLLLAPSLLRVHRKRTFL